MVAPIEAQIIETILTALPSKLIKQPTLFID